MLRRRPAVRASIERRGAVAVLVAISMLVLIAILALVLDGGLMMIERRHVQAAADASALAASYAFEESDGDVEAARLAAVSFAGANGFPEGAGVELTLSSPPESGPFAGQEDFLEIILESRTARLFSGLWGSDELVVSGRSVVRRRTPPPASLVLLDAALSGALELTGKGRLVMDSRIRVNSAHSTALTATNGGHTLPETPGKPGVPVIRVVGNYMTDTGGTLSGKVQTGRSASADPLAGLPVPPESGPLFNGLSQNWGTLTIDPGVYNGGLTLGGGMQITMNPGTYYMKGGGFAVGNEAKLTGHGVMIYVDPGGGQFSFQGGGEIDLSPPTGGTFEGITLYQDRASTQDIAIANGASTTITGTIYAAGARISFAGGALSNRYGNRLIARSMKISNDAVVGIGGDDPAPKLSKIVE